MVKYRTNYLLILTFYTIISSRLGSQNNPIVNKQFIFELSIINDAIDTPDCRYTQTYYNYKDRPPSPKTPFYCSVLFFYNKDTVIYVSFNNTRFNDDILILSPTTCVLTSIVVTKEPEKHIRFGKYSLKNDTISIALNQMSDSLQLNLIRLDSDSLELVNIIFNNTIHKSIDFFGFTPIFCYSVEKYITLKL